MLKNISHFLQTHLRFLQNPHNLMENELISQFISTNAPQFFSQALSDSLTQSSADQKILKSFLLSIDSLQLLLSSHKIPPIEILKATFLGLSATLPALSMPVILTKLLKQIEFLLNFELLRAHPTSEILQILCKLGRSLSFQMAITQDSSAFNKFFILEVLPRYAHVVPSQYLLDLSRSFELIEETEKFLNKEKISWNKLTESEDKVEEVKVLNKEYFKIGIPGKVKIEKAKVGRSLVGNGIKKQVSIKSMKKVLTMTPKRNEEEISVEAKKLRDFNQDFFYKKKGEEINEVEIKESEGDVLVVSTPVREENEMEEDLWKFKSVFQM